MSAEWLIEVEPTVPRSVQRLNEVKERFGILTDDAGPKYDEDSRWEALWVKGARQHFGQRVATALPVTIFGWISTYGRLLDEWNLLGYGPTEAEAVLDVCRKNQLRVPPL